MGSKNNNSTYDEKMNDPLKYFACTKTILIILNLLLFCTGMVFIGIGIWFRVDPKMYEPTNYIETANYIYAGWIMMFSGLVMIIMSFVGCIGICTNSTCRFAFYILVLSILLIFAICGLVLSSSYGFGERLETYTTQQILINIQNGFLNERSRELLHFIQVKLKCCGATSYNDYQRYGQPVPTSCHREQTNYINQEGCALVLARFYDLRGGIAFGLFAFAAIIELIAIICALIIYCAIKNAEYDE